MNCPKMFDPKALKRFKITLEVQSRNPNTFTGWEKGQRFDVFTYGIDADDAVNNDQLMNGEWAPYLKKVAIKKVPGRGTREFVNQLYSEWVSHRDSVN